MLLSTPDYDSSLRLSTKAYHVFKYADRPVLQFQCQVTLCLKLDGGCLGITPPKCPETKPLHLQQNGAVQHGAKRSRLASRRRSRSQRIDTTNPTLTPLDVFTKPIMIIDEQFAGLVDCSFLDTPLNNTSLQNSKNAGFWQQKMSISAPIFAALTILNLIVSSAAIIFCVIHRRVTHKKILQDYAN